MNRISSFLSKKPFYAQQHFPYGMSKSGDFTRDQAILLEEHGEAYEALFLGTREPVTEEESEFVAVCNGKKDAVTEHEKAWQVYSRIIQKKKPYITAFGSIFPKVDQVDSPLDSEL